MRMPLRARRRPELPPDLAEALGVVGERVLAWSTLSGEPGAAAAACVEGLRVLTPMGRLIRRPWTEVDRVAWDQDSATLAVWWVGSRGPTPLEVGAGSFLPEVVHERVRASVVIAQDVPVAGRTVWVALRKAHDGTLTTQAVAPVGLRLRDPDVVSALVAAQNRLREEAGLPPDGSPPLVIEALAGDR